MAFRFRPSIILAVALLGIVALYGLYQGYTEVATGCTGRIIALGMKLLEGQNGGG